MDQRQVAEQVRAFNRFYTEAIGSLDDKHEGVAVTLAESRVLYTVGSLDSSSVNEIAARLDLDLAYTSRILSGLEDSKLIVRKISTQDRRQRVVKLSAKGRRLLTEIENRSNQRVSGLIGHLDALQVEELLAALSIVQSLLSNKDLTHD